MGTSSILNSVLAATTGANSTGIDVTSTVNTILYADRAPERSWQAQQATLASQSAAINQLEVEASALSDSLNALRDVGGALSSIAATSSDPSVATASAVPGTVVGNHTLVVNNLATTASWYTNSLPSSSSELGAGQFTLTAGSSSTVIETGSGVNTLDQLAASINAQSLGVSASVVTDASGARLSLVATSTGAAADFSVSASSGLSFTRSGTGTDASFKIDGVPLTSASNTVSGAINGLTLTLQSASPATVSIALAPDTSSITQTISSFVSAYNVLIKDVNSQFSYNSTSKTAALLGADSTIQGLQAALLNSTNYSSETGAYQSLASLGISANQDGTLSLDAGALSTAINTNFAAVTSFFEGAASNGFGNALANALNTYTDPSQGAFTVDLASINSSSKDLDTQINTLELYLSTEQQRLTTQYNNADIALQQLPQKLKQINALLNPNNSSSNG